MSSNLSIYSPVETQAVNGQLCVKLNTGHLMPMVGLGTWQINDPSIAKKAVRNSIKAGYRLIDTAYWYENEEAIGEELEALFKEGVVKREELFITTKLHPSFMGRDEVVPTLKLQLAKLKLQYVDLFLIHWPFSYVNKNGSVWPADPKTGKVTFDYTKHYTETWKGMEDAYRLGLAKSIGISNFNKRQVEDILLRANIRPAVNQIESHPLNANIELIEYCQIRNIAITAYSAFANPGSSFAPKNSTKYPNLIVDSRLLAIAAKYPGKSTAQIMLRWQIERGAAVIPKSTSEEHLKSNLNIFDFHLSPEDVRAIAEMNKNIRISGFPDGGNSSSRDYPFDELRDVQDLWA